MDVRENLIVRNVNNIVSEKIFFHDYNKEKYKNFLYPVLAGVSEPDKNYFCQRAESDPCNPYMYVMEYVAKGKGYIICNGERFTVEAGDFYMINRNTAPCYFPSVDDPYQKKWINVCGKFIDGLCHTYQFIEPVLVARVDVEQEIDQLHLILSEYDFSNSYESDVRMMQIFVSIFEKIRRSRTKEEQKNCLEFEQIAEYISKNLVYEKLSRSYLCSYFFVSNRSLDRMFQKHVGMSPARYIMLQKILYAQKILLSENCSIELLADMLHFSSAAHFRRAFVEHCGLSPMKWKKDQKNKNKTSSQD